jgi:starch phosphorylase
VGWALGDGQEHGDDPAWDAAEAEALYDLLERQVIPEFYDRNEKGIPGSWVERIRKSMAQLTPRFSANRTVREYTEKYYLPLATTCKARTDEKGKISKQIVEKLHALQQNWSTIQFGELKVETDGDMHTFEAEVYLNAIEPNAVLVELYANGIDGAAPLRQELKFAEQQIETNKPHVYRAMVPSTRPASDYTPRVIPNFPGVNVPLETDLILWRS